MDHRRLQRTLFRMQLDPDFADALRGGEEAAARSTGLGAQDLQVLVETDRAGVEADLGGRRRAQFLGNVASEFLLTTWTAVQAGADPELVESFTASGEFHEAAASDGRFPLAFAAHASRRAAAAGDAALSAFASLEVEMARARRELVERRPPAEGEWVLAGTARLVEAPAGTFESAAALRAGLDAGARPGPARLDAAATETILVHAASAPTAARRAEVSVEPLGELPAALLRLAESGLDAAGRARACAEWEVELADLEEFAASLTDEGLLRRAP